LIWVCYELGDRTELILAYKYLTPFIGLYDKESIAFLALNEEIDV